MSDGLFISALGVLAAVIGALWKINQGNASKIEKRAEKIEEKNDTNEKEMRKMAEDIGELRGEIGLAKKVIPKLDKLHADFLEVYPKKKD